MVRLKHTQHYYFSLAFKWSQFHYGSIKTNKYDNTIVYNRGLNSTMVRLKLRKSPFTNKSAPCLNSTMVRLKLNNGIYLASHPAVSIPLWFD